MAIRVLIINRQLVFAVTLKQALEQTGTFDVHPFTTADAAFDFLRDHPQDVALVDFTLPGRSGAKIIQQLRGIQPDLAVIISPRQPDADALMKALRLQGMIDMPYGARDVIPLIERAVEQAQLSPPGEGEPAPLSSEPPAPKTRILGEEVPPEPQGQLTTRNLGEEENQVRQQFGTTHLLDESKGPPDDAPAQTRNLGEPSGAGSQTRNFGNEDDGIPGGPYPDEIRGFDEDSAPQIKPVRRNEGQTHELGDVSPIRPIGKTGQTRRFDDVDQNPPAEPMPPPSTGTRDLGGSPMDNLFYDESGSDQAMPRRPSTMPEVSSLESVLQSFGFDPPVGEEDTPAVPLSDSDALRQFLATSEQGAGGAEHFDDVLGAIDPNEVDVARREESPFEDLVKSMRRNTEPHQPLPNRQSNLMDFTLTTGMDAVLREIEKSKTGPVIEPPPLPDIMPEEPSIPQPEAKGLFERLAEEEPPHPTFEESGTVGDLMLGVSDVGFQNVLSLLRGDEVDSDEAAPPRPARRPQKRDPYTAFFGPSIDSPTPSVPDEIDQERPVPSSNRPDTYSFEDFEGEDESDEATVAQVILQTALEDADLPDGFSLNQLLTDIENRLTLHKLSVRPLPSWNMDTGVFRPVSEADIREPDFLPEELPPGERVSLDKSLEFDEPESYTGRTTRASMSNQITHATAPEDEDTLFDARILEDTASSRAVSPVEEINLVEEESVEAGSMSQEPELAVSGDEGDSGEVVVETSPWTIEDQPAEVETPGDEEQEYREPEMEEGMSFLAPLLKNAPTDEVPDVLPTEDEWDIQIEPEADEAAELAETFSADVDWTLESGAEELWGIPDDLEAESPDAEDTGEEWVLETGAAELWGVPDESEAADAIEQPELTQANWDLQAEEEEWDIQIGSTDGEEIQEQGEFPADEDWALASEADNAWELETENQYDEPVPVEFPSDEWELPSESAEPGGIPEDPYIAQLALNLTQFSLESSSEGSILTRNGEIVAYAGHLSDEDTLELRDVINNDWDANPDGARIRFITLPSSGKDYMLYSIRTDADLTLSMIFAGTTPLRVIRQQGHRLAAALESIPDVVAEQMPFVETEVSESDAIVPIESRAEEAVRNPHSYIWLLNDPESQLTDAMAQAMIAGLTTQLSERGWKIHDLQIHEDFVYLYGDIPGESPSHEIIRDLKRRSSEIAHAQNLNITPQMLWADAYYVLTPGRDLHIEEIQEFINFQRMA